MRRKKSQEVQQKFFVVPEDSVQYLPYESNIDHKFRDSEGRFKRLKYKSFAFSAGEVLDLLPEKDRTFDEKKNLTVNFSEIYQGLSDQSQLFIADFSECYDGDPEFEREINCLLKSSVRWDRRVRQLAECNMFMQAEDGKIIQASFCRVRLCPLCSWRRSLKIAVHTRKILEAMMKDDLGCEFLFLTLTVPNVFDMDLAPTIDKMQKAWSKMTDPKGKTLISKRFNGSVIGWYRGLEITRNMDYYQVYYVRDPKTGKKIKKPVILPDGTRPLNPWYGSYHPHYHVILAVPKYYFNHSLNYYIDQQEWLSMWQTATGDRTIKEVDVRQIKPNKKLLDQYKGSMTREQLKALAVISAVEEATHYTVKSDDYILDSKATRTLDLALERRRLVAYGGKFAEYRKRLQLDDEVDGDLLHVGDDDTPKNNSGRRSYAFSVGFRHYIRIDGR